MRKPKPGYESRSTPTQHILDSALLVFMSLGYKKASMDDLASAAGLSRPGLYFHFPSKEQLFTATIEHLAQRIISAVHAALARTDLDLADRILAAFDALHPKELDFNATKRMSELLEAAVTNAPAIVEKLRRDFIRSVAETLDSSNVGATWKKRDVTPKQLAEHLLAASDGVKAWSGSRSGYRASMRLAIQIVLEGAGGDR